jgi:hypothetical protein
MHMTSSALPVERLEAFWHVVTVIGRDPLGHELAT